jgi:chromosomal replication initiation ATPase DnaA
MINNDHYKIIDIVCEVYGTSYITIIKPCRRQEYVFPRYACFYFLRKYTKLTNADIGMLFGKRHSSIINAHKPYEDLLFCNKNVRKKHEIIIRLLNKKSIPYNENALICEYEKW